MTDSERIAKLEADLAALRKDFEMLRASIYQSALRSRGNQIGNSGGRTGYGD